MYHVSAQGVDERMIMRLLLLLLATYISLIRTMLAISRTLPGFQCQYNLTAVGLGR